MQSVKTPTLDVNTRTPLSWDVMIRRLAPCPSWDDMVASLRSKPAQLREESALYSATLLAQTRDSMTRTRWCSECTAGMPARIVKDHDDPIHRMACRHFVEE